MKIKNTVFIIITTLIALNVYAGGETGYKYKFKIKGAEDTTIFLANYFGSKLYYTDTATSDKKGYFEFTGSKKLDQGKYAVVVPGPKYFEIFLADNEEIEMETDTSDFVKYMKVIKSENNKIFYDYIQYISNKKEEVTVLNKELIDFGADSVKSKATSTALVNINKEVEAYQQSILKNHADKFVTKDLKMSIDVAVPPAPENIVGDKNTKDYQYYWYKNHYWDNVDLKDTRIVRTPIFHKKLDTYFNKLLIQLPDTINEASDKLIEQVKYSDELFKYVVHFVTYNFETSKIMGMDAVFVHMAEKYYMTKQVTWLDSTKLANVAERCMEIKPTLIGNKAPYLRLLDYQDKNWVNLYDLKSDITIMYFWDQDCGHCKKETPKLKEIYEKYKAEGKKIEVYAVGVSGERDKWKTYVEEQGFIDWINVSDTPEQRSPFRTLYDTQTTPRVFILDKDKKIVAKQIGVEQIEEFITRMLEKDKKMN
jgi:thiol-disulfide isomerase/thioredoxin